MRTLSDAAYERRIRHHRRAACVSMIRWVVCATIGLGVMLGAFETIAHADAPRRATPAVQRAVDRVVGHHVPHLWQECRGRKCAAFTRDMSTAVVLFETGAGYRVTSIVR
jgi:hypothetical protein